MILIDTGPLFALFNPRDTNHLGCKEILKNITGIIYTTLPVVVEVCYLLTASHCPINAFSDFIVRGGVDVYSIDNIALEEIFKLMKKYKDQDMDFTDASIVYAAEALKITRIFTLDHRDFSIYKIRRGHRFISLEIISP